MNVILKASAALAAGAALVSMASASFAQDEHAPPRQPPTAEQRAAWRQAREAEHAQRLTAVLNLRADQQPALQTFLAAMTPPHEDRDAHRDRGDDAQLTTPQRLDRMADRMARHEADFHRRADAIRTFYAALTPEQQRAFDALPMLTGGHDHGPDGGPHWRHAGPDAPPPAAS